jgi:hypothetical protein
MLAFVKAANADREAFAQPRIEKRHKGAMSAKVNAAALIAPRGT